MYYDQMIDFQNCTPGNVGILKLSYNATLDKLHLKLGGGLTAAHLGKIEGKANGVTFFEDDVAFMLKRDAYLGVFTQADTVTIDFTEPNTKGGAAQQYLAALPRNLLTSLTFEVTIKDTAPVGMTLKCEGEYRDPTQNPFILRRKRFAIPLSVRHRLRLVLRRRPAGRVDERAGDPAGDGDRQRHRLLRRQRLAGRHQRYHSGGAQLRHRA